MTRQVRSRHRSRSRKRQPLRTGGLIIALVVGLLMLADRGDFERMVSDLSGAGVANNDLAEISDANRFNGRVIRIVDGDTFWISGQDVRIRIWALDAPETAAPGGAAATAELAQLTSYHELTCQQRDIDRYGRIVGQCFLPDGRDITAAMIESNTATEYCSFSNNHYGTC